jgi:hypothetical protein
MKMIFNKSRFKILLFCLKRMVNLKVLEKKKPPDLSVRFFTF